jgi:hypothetical protein
MAIIVIGPPAGRDIREPRQASAGGNVSRDFPPVDRTGRHSIDRKAGEKVTSRIRSCAILLTVAAHAQAASAVRPLQFDLVCNARGHVAADPQNRHPSGQMTWRTHIRYVVDLRTRLFCEPWVCVHYGAGRIVAANAREIILYDHPIVAGRRNSLRVTIRNRDGYYRYRTAHEDGYTRVSTGICRRERFSGFPARGSDGPPFH